MPTCNCSWNCRALPFGFEPLLLFLTLHFFFEIAPLAARLPIKPAKEALAPGLDSGDSAGDEQRHDNETGDLQRRPPGEQGDEGLNRLLAAENPVNSLRHGERRLRGRQRHGRHGRRHCGAGGAAVGVGGATVGTGVAGSAVAVGAGCCAATGLSAPNTSAT
jgi:hypothetical protein